MIKYFVFLLVVLFATVVSAQNWSWPGDIRTHLSGPPHYVDVSGMSFRQMVTLHNELHESGDLDGPVNSGAIIVSAPGVTVVVDGLAHGVMRGVRTVVRKAVYDGPVRRAYRGQRMFPRLR